VELKRFYGPIQRTALAMSAWSARSAIWAAVRPSPFFRVLLAPCASRNCDAVRLPFARRHHQRRIAAAGLGRDRVDARAARQQQAAISTSPLAAA
jgi:hypothetical protein